MQVAKNDAWRIRFDVKDFQFPEGSDITRLEAEDIGLWVRSVKHRFQLEPRTVRRVCAHIHTGLQLVRVTPQALVLDVAHQGLNLTQTQAFNVCKAVSELKKYDKRAWPEVGDGADGAEMDADDTVAATVQLDLTAYWPKVLEPGRRTARKSRYADENIIRV